LVGHFSGQFCNKFTKYNLFDLFIFRNALEVDLKIERDWRSGLQEELTRVNENLSQMEGRARDLEELKQVLRQRVFPLN
jgi:hypothetical protein